MMKILFVSTESPFPVDHGHHIRTFHVLNMLAQDHSIHFVGFTQSGSGYDHLSKLSELCESVELFELRYYGWKTIILALLNIFSSYPLIAQKYYDNQALDRMRSLIDDAKIDLIHIDMLHLANYRRQLPPLPCILVNHNVESLRLFRWSKIERNILLKLFLNYQYYKLRRFEKIVCPEFERCIAVSDHDKELLSRLCGKGNFVTIVNPVNAEYFQPSDKAIVPGSLVWAGSMRSFYNRDAVDFYLQDIWSIIKGKIPWAKTVFVGGSPSETLRQVAREDPNIAYTGYVDDVRPYLSNSAVFVAPIRSGSGTKIKLLNAMSQAKPVVTTSVGVEGIEAEIGAEIMVADRPMEFAEKVIYLIRNPEAAQKMGLRARKVIEEKYDIKIVGKKINHLYNEVINLGSSEKELLI